MGYPLAVQMSLTMAAVLHAASADDAYTMGCGTELYDTVVTGADGGKVNASQEEITHDA